jgi:hypothetical protein
VEAVVSQEVEEWREAGDLDRVILSRCRGGGGGGGGAGAVPS